MRVAMCNLLHRSDTISSGRPVARPVHAKKVDVKSWSSATLAAIAAGWRGVVGSTACWCTRGERARVAALRVAAVSQRCERTHSVMRMGTAHLVQPRVPRVPRVPLVAHGPCQHEAEACHARAASEVQVRHALHQAALLGELVGVRGSARSCC